MSEMQGNHKLPILTTPKAIIACMVDETCAGELIAAAVFCARGLGILDGRRAQLKTNGNTEQQLVEKAVLFLFSFEGGHSVDHGMPPVSPVVPVYLDDKG